VNHHKFLILNGSPLGSEGNTSVLLDLAEKKLGLAGAVSRINLADKIDFDEIAQNLKESDGFLFGTGTYWDSWGSPLQAFFEAVTQTEGSDLWLGKPAAAIVTMHSVGGKDVLSRLLGVLNTFGVLIPPMSAMVYSAVNQVALKSSTSPVTNDLWCPEDIEVVCDNLVQACQGTNKWKRWPTDRTEFKKVWLKL